MAAAGTGAGPDVVPVLVRPRRPSHRELIPKADPLRSHGPAVDAILVPASRHVSGLAAIADLAAAGGRLLVVLCSRDARARSVAAHLTAGRPQLRLLALDVPVTARRWTAELATGRHAHAGGDGYPDTTTKRNLALLVAKLSGWGRVLLIDDDLGGFDPRICRSGAGLGGRPGGRDVVGWVAERFPDNSVVCLAARHAGLAQGTFPGGGFYAVRTRGVAPAFFPTVYNDDWLFVFDAIADGRMALGGTIRQRPYDPFAHPVRARVQEFGDVLGEGLFELLHCRLPVQAGFREEYWRGRLTARSRFIEEIDGRLVARARRHELPVGGPDVGSVRASLAAAAERLGEISAESLADFVVRWRADLVTWREMLAGLPRVGSPEAALGYLGLDYVSSEG